MKNIYTEKYIYIYTNKMKCVYTIGAICMDLFYRMLKMVHVLLKAHFITSHFKS